MNSCAGLARNVASWLVVLTALTLAACAPVRLREDSNLAQAQSAREAALGAQSNWTLKARIAVSNGDDGGSGELEWQQHGDRYDFTVHAPVTGKTWHLHGDAHEAILEGVEAMPLVGTDPAELLRDKVGWIVPLHELTAWVRALRAPQGKAQISYNDHSLPAVLQQSGWTVEYKEYFDTLNPPLPRKVFAAKPPYRVRMVIERWSFDP
ncbi:outer membrane lipoprotein LolB [Pseudolysobacter antarcticus]|uniref:Outer-membrane lipoprotein LolB n=1 Tax=Pseudolysobacter antarcticus TaxID=2511995 RepID=A0A411HM39_9GAMM|nr:lipoprotein insertase outer membrane protein LolB [Pseudolysobacter antarcticus]QBB71591.1 outer membrane lipoprotein LolB [Pseudolysobacter antarcticus]